MDRSEPLRVMHVLDALDGDGQLWGKERVVAALMREQRTIGTVLPRLVTFGTGHLATTLAAEGFRTDVLGSTALVPAAAGARLARLLAADPVDVIHSHGYKANVVARALRLLGLTHGVRLVGTAHGWVETTRAQRCYNALDRWTSVVGDMTTVPDPAMLARFPRWARTRHVANGVPEIDSVPLPSIGERSAFVAGTLGRVSEEKGIPELLAAARSCPDASITFAVAGAGGLSEQVRQAGPNVRYVGYVEPAQPYLSQLDVYVQASRSEGLSLALLEAMRAGKPIVATDVGATSDAIRDDESGVLVPPGRPDRTLAAILALRNDPERAAGLGRNARARFTSEFHLRRQHERFYALYTGQEAVQ